ncbi:ubiquitin carboxyl-terminal hydrolase 17-like protein 6 [Perognathus longimembris pacificus]|uniref:ubiquitin carboxyl-terminal hydrolase 17-like protein 6 n=1 Tax=Perognathus longimembris pacificus TaxID=214514 RepID=UPI0020194BA4|nr:ubiquitin carboxyl-terminal hydrolase 17-like protein 6 [Perognathus longimembris pacificus]
METTRLNLEGLSQSLEEERSLQKDMSPLQTELAPRKYTSLHWKQPSKVGAGLLNTGNTCYMNAILQCLTHTGPLASHMLSRGTCQMPCHQKSCMMCVVQAHMKRAFQHSGDTIQPSYALGAGFHMSLQEDAHEFLMFLFESMEQSCQSCPKGLDLLVQESSLIREIFGGYWRSQIRCLQCHSTSDTFDPYVDIPLDIEGAQSVGQALGRLVMPEELSGENSYHCAACLQKVSASKTLTLQSASKVLVLVLKRFSSWTGDKLDRTVQFPESLDMQPYMSQHNAEALVYDLYAVLVHAGLSRHSGHYFSYIKAGNGQWYKMDDAKVTSCDVSSVLSQCAYVLFYTQRSSDINGHRDAVLLSRNPTAPEAEEKEGRTHQLDKTKYSHLKHLESQPDAESPAVKEISLDQWKSFQEQNRPKSEFNLRKIEFTQDSNLVMIHPSKHRDQMRGNHSDKENPLSQNCYQSTTGQMSRNSDQDPCKDTTARSNKRKNKQRKKEKKYIFVLS